MIFWEKYSIKWETWEVMRGESREDHARRGAHCAFRDCGIAMPQKKTDCHGLRPRKGCLEDVLNNRKASPPRKLSAKQTEGGLRR